jgi:hypothetical protein
VVSAVGLAFSGAASATDSDASVLVHESTTVDNSTNSVYADVTGGNYSATADFTGPVAVNVTFTGHNSSQSVSNGTVLSTQSLSVASESVSSASYTLSDTETTDYDKVHVKIDVVTSGEETEIASTDWGVLQSVSGGGGGFLDSGIGLGTIGGVPIILLVLVIAGFFVLGDD